MSQAALIQTLTLEANAIAAFGRALAEERDAIKRQDFQTLSDLLDKKMELAQVLTRATAAREAQMIALGLRVGEGGLLVGRPVDAEAAEAWRKVVFFAHKAKDVNELNGAIVNVPSFQVSPADVVAIRERAKKQTRIQDSLAVAEQVGFPEWLDVDTKKMQGIFKNVPERSDLPADINESLVVELYSK